MTPRGRERVLTAWVAAVILSVSVTGTSAQWSGSGALSGSITTGTWEGGLITDPDGEFDSLETVTPESSEAATEPSSADAPEPIETPEQAEPDEQVEPMVPDEPSESSKSDGTEGPGESEEPPAEEQPDDVDETSASSADASDAPATDD
ncbi:MAG: hypothetical protein ACTHZ5_09035 [Micrococcaceae bacterium]